MPKRPSHLGNVGYQITHSIEVRISHRALNDGSDNVRFRLHCPTG